MPALAQEARIPLAIEALRTTRGLSIRRTAKLYDILESSLRDRMKGRPLKAETYNARHNLTLAEEETFVRYILDLDSRRFAPRIRSVEDIANSLLTTHRASPVGKM